jgi:mRNA interferase MazF
LRRGELWTVAGGSAYAGKPRPAIIVQDDAFNDTASVSVCPITSEEIDAALFRLPLRPDGRNGLLAVSWAMVDKIAAVPRSRVGKRIGSLAEADTASLDQAILTFFGLGV